jgi:hypothetical protein
MNTKQTQTEQILTHLRNHGSITQLDAYELYGCMRLGARIWDIKRMLIPVESRTRLTGSGKRIAEYVLAGEN